MIGVKLSERYEIIRELGRGEAGVVYLARDPLLDREVAIKLLPPNLSDLDAVERFKRDARILAKMDHPAIVVLYNIGEHEGSFYCVMPFVSGTNLGAFLRDHSLTLKEVADLGIQVAEGLEYSHSLDVLHGNLKPENIMVTREAQAIRVRITDFGLATIAKGSALHAGNIAYLSPEQLSRGEADIRSDIYSLGTILYECLTGVTPFSGEAESILNQILNEAPRSPRSARSEIAEEVERIVLQCLEKDAEQRPQCAKQVADALAPFGSERSGAILQGVELGRAAPTFVGREKEFALLKKKLYAACQGECRFAVVAGEVGIGKSRLLDELENLAKEKSILILHGRFMEPDRASSYQGFSELIQDYFRAKPGFVPDADFSDLAPDLLSLFPVLNEITEIRSAYTGEAKLGYSTEGKKVDDRTYVFEVLARTLIRMAAGHPLVVLLEDLHAADVSLDALSYVIRRLGPTPTFIVGTYRTTEVNKRHPLFKMLDTFVGDPRFHSITLEPLDAGEHRALLETILAGSGIESSLTDKLYEATEGNPYFTKELVRSLVDSGGIHKDEGGSWTLVGDAQILSEALPSTIQQTIERRVENLTNELRNTLSLASILGKTFEFRDLKMLTEESGFTTPSPKNIDDVIDQLIKEGFIEEIRASRGDRLTFSSGVLRDVLYAKMSRRKRKLLHRKYAEQLEKRYSDRLDRIYPQLVHHFSEGEIQEKVVEYGLKLARKSLDAFSAEEAIRTARIVLEFLEEEEERKEQLEAEARGLLAAALRMNGNLDGALKEWERVITIFEKLEQSSEVVKGIVMTAETAWEGRRIDETRKWAERGLIEARSAGERENLIRLLTLSATVANLRGEYEKAKAYLEEIQQIQPASEEPEEEIFAGGKLVVTLPLAIRPVHPVNIQVDEEAEILANVYETLLKNDAQGNLISCLCERWEVLEQGKTFLFTLCKKARAKDGRSLTASRIKTCFESSIRRSGGSLPAAFAAIKGVSEFLSDPQIGVLGINAVGEDRLRVELLEPLPIYPALLTDVRTAIVLEEQNEGDAEPRRVGTGPFAIASWNPENVVLEKCPDYWKETPPALEAVEFRTSLNAAEIARGLRSGEFDLAGNLLPEDVEEVLRDRRLKANLVEVPKNNVYFALFNSSSPTSRIREIRLALCGIVRTHDLVRQALGRFAKPAEGLLPPGILGHDPGRRRQSMPREKALQLLQSLNLPFPIKLKASLHPIFMDRYTSLTTSLFRVWSDIGFEAGPYGPASYFEHDQKNEEIDVLFGRWIADYNDPDNFTYGMFHSQMGYFRNYYSSKELDQLVEEARVESDPSVRIKLYRKIENFLMETGFFLPLFHDLDYRIANPSVRRLTLRSSAPYVNYEEVRKLEMVSTVVDRTRGGVLHIPFSTVVNNLDPTRVFLAAQAEVIPTIFETLTQMEGAHVVPQLASEVRAEQGGKRFHFRLHEGVRFHDGRQLAARDVRYSFERLLQDRDSESRWILSSICGAKAILNGESRNLEGFQILSANEFIVELDEPVSYFPAMLAYPVTAIVPEGTNRLEGNWRTGCVGTGPFRVVRFDATRRLELESNPYYWRHGYPKSDGLIFYFGVTPSEILSGYKAGQFSLAWELLLSDVELLRHEPEFAAGFREVPRLSTYYLAFNTHRGPLTDEALRHKLRESIDVDSFIRRNPGRIAIPAHGFVPPGLLGYDPERISLRQPTGKLSGEVALTAMLNSVYQGPYSGFATELFAAFQEKGFRVRIVEGKSEYFTNQAQALAQADLLLTRWIADYADADNFVSLLHSATGLLGCLCGTAEVDRLIEKGRTETNPQVRHGIYREIERFIAEHALLLPLFHEQGYCFPHPDVQDFQINFFQPFVAYDKLWVKS